MSLWFALLIWMGVADAGEFFLEGPVHDARSDAVASSRAARSAGLDARVVRRYKSADGWEYVVRISGFSDQGSAVAAVDRVTELLGGALTLFAVDEPDGDPIQVHFSDERQPTGDDDDEDVEAELPSALQPTIDAHGGPRAGAAALAQAGAVLFRYQRTLPDGAVVGHTWSRQGTSVYAAIEKIEGEVQPSTTLVTESGAWLSVGDAEPAAQDRERALETLETLAPEAVVPFVLSFASLAEQRSELQTIHDGGQSELDGKPVKVLRAEGDQASGPLVLDIDPRTKMVRRVDFDEGALVVQFDGWGRHSSGGVILPDKVRTWRDGSLVDTVEILEIDLEPTLPKAWFEAP